LMAGLTGARISDNVVDRYPNKVERKRVTLRPQRTDRVLGYSIPPNEQAGYLKALHLPVVESGLALDVEVPTFRPDIQREVDLIEEVARLAGFDRLPATVPPGQAGVLDRPQQADRALRHVLAGEGLFEAWTSSFFSEADLDRLGLPSEHVVRRLVRIANPMSQEEDAMRTTLFPGLLRSVSRNFAQQRAKGIGLFEIARVYEPGDGELPHEGSLLSAVMGGERVPQTWAEAARPWDFYAAKGVLTNALDALRVAHVSFSERSTLPFHPTRAANVVLEDRVIGVLGELHPSVCSNFEVPEGCVAFEIALAPVFAAMPQKPTVTELPKFPAVFLDLAVVTNESVASSEVQNVIASAGSPELVSVRLFDIYRGPQVPEGKKSLAFALELRDPARTLTDEDQTSVRERITAALRDQLGAELRT
jgi:phenylalanyl-tRNA synthetase beta chain